MSSPVATVMELPAAFALHVHPSDISCYVTAAAVVGITSKATYADLGLLILCRSGNLRHPSCFTLHLCMLCQAHELAHNMADIFCHSMLLLGSRARQLLLMLKCTFGAVSAISTSGTASLNTYASIVRHTSLRIFWRTCYATLQLKRLCAMQDWLDMQMLDFL